MSSKIERKKIALNLRHYGPQPRICVRSFSAITTYHDRLSDKEYPSRSQEVSFRERRTEMEQIPFDDPQDAAIADNVLQHLRHALQLLASPAQAQLSHFP